MAEGEIKAMLVLRTALCADDVRAVGVLVEELLGLRARNAELEAEKALSDQVDRIYGDAGGFVVRFASGISVQEAVQLRARVAELEEQNREVSRLHLEWVDAAAVLGQEVARLPGRVGELVRHHAGIVRERIRSLTAERDQLAAVVERVQALPAVWLANPYRSVADRCARDLKAALAPPGDGGGG